MPTALDPTAGKQGRSKTIVAQKAKGGGGGREGGERGPPSQGEGGRHRRGVFVEPSQHGIQRPLKCRSLRTEKLIQRKLWGHPLRGQRVEAERAQAAPLQGRVDNHILLGATPDSTADFRLWAGDPAETDLPCPPQPPREMGLY